MVAEILELSDMIVPLEVSPLFPTIEKHMMEELVQNYEDLHYIKQMLLVTHNSRITTLLGSCQATIISFHFDDFIKDMRENPNPAFTELVEDHVWRRERTSVMSSLLKTYAKSQCVRSFVRKVAPVEQQD
ncbi:Exocyst complex component Sec8 [Caenorhabditis elegans]|uniref:Exocyst complex component Sec8 n=1 Tax=Caenorhabditis elegans TaxID=6239 RepID=Q20266_CAEEL|nr:Exocyst complex component Sec8 [Caenorhabditis elegans]CCD65857.1 Exocyst complex component Sec8 [Caenorhabditis elegans]|eukprot:NP_494850.1 Uncharacterized protein CELE_F41C3.1 [Caenorhabditis elegans]